MAAVAAAAAAGAAADVVLGVVDGVVVAAFDAEHQRRLGQRVRLVVVVDALHHHAALKTDIVFFSVNQS